MDFLALIDNSLGTNFSEPEYDPAKGRKKLVRQIELAKRQFTDNVTRAPKRNWYTGSNKAISFEPKIDGKNVLIGSEPINYVPSERFVEFLDKLKQAVEAGRLDNEIKDALDGETPSVGADPKRRAAGSRTTGEKFPKHLRDDYESLEPQQRRNLGLWWSKNKNPDQSLRSEVGDNPNAPYKAPTK